MYIQQLLFRILSMREIFVTPLILVESKTFIKKPLTLTNLVESKTFIKNTHFNKENVNLKLNRNRRSHAGVSLESLCLL